MNPIVKLFVSGHAFFIATGLLLVTVSLQWFSWGRQYRRASRLTALVAGVIIILSGTPLPIWLYLMSSALVLLWMVLEGEGRAQRTTYATYARIAVLMACVVAISMEAPWHRTPVIEEGDYKVVYVVADSITAGIAVDEKTWPMLFRERYGVDVVDLSRGGETVKTALRAIGRVTRQDALVIMEIGGNDFLNKRTPISEFEETLDDLLTVLAVPGRRVVMLELPLPPLHNGYGMVQRRLAKRHGVALIPKRHFTNILAAKDATVDGLHLSQKGQDAMAEMLWGIVGDAVKPGI